MKIAMFTDSYRPQINGMVTSVEAFTKYLRKKGHDVHIFAPHVPGYMDKDRHVHRFRSFAFRSYREYRIGMPYKFLTDPRLKKLDFDVVHVHSPFSMGVAGITYASYHKIPVVGTFHTMFPDYAHYFMNEKLYRIKRIYDMFKRGAWKYLSWFYNNCDIVISPSDYTKKMMRKNYIAKKIIVIPTGIETKKSTKKKKSLRKKYKFKKTDKIILHVGRITKEKNILFILDSVKKIIEKDEKIKMIIASDGPFADETKKYTKSIGISKNVFFTGYVSREKLQELYLISDVFVMASATETQVIVLLEAAINGLPCVVLDAPVITDFVIKYEIGIVAKNNNFAQKLEKAIFDGYRFSNRKIMNEYSIEKCAQKLIDVYESLCRR